MISTEELLESVYENYLNQISGEDGTMYPKFLDILDYEVADEWATGGPCWFYIKKLSKEEFINKIKTDSNFANTWGVDVSVRELSLEERVEIARKTLSEEEFYKYGLISPFTTFMITYWLNQHNISTKVITITDNNKTIEIYE